MKAFLEGLEALLAEHPDVAIYSAVDEGIFPSISFISDSETYSIFRTRQNHVKAQDIKRFMRELGDK